MALVPCRILALMLICGMSKAFETDLEFSADREIRPNHGVIFQPLNKKLLVTSSVYDLIFAIQRPRWARYKSCDQQTTGDLYVFCQTLSPDERSQYEYLTQSINEAVDGVDMILHAPVTPDNDTRSAREPALGFIGRLSRSWFGTATTNDLSIVASKMNQAIARINRQDTANQDQFNLLESAINASSTAINNLQRGMMLNFRMITSISEWQNNTYNMFKNQSLDIQRIAGSVTELQTYVEGVLARKLTMFDKLQQVAILSENFLKALSQLASGFLSPHLVPPRILKQNIKMVQRSLNKLYRGNRLVHTDLSYYYNGHHLTSYTYTNDHLFIHVQVPFALESSLFDVYSVHSFPVPLKPDDPAAYGYTKVNDIIDYIAISNDKDRYVEMDRAEMSLCDQNRIMSCPKVQVIRRRPALTCTSSIFFQDHDSFMALCNPRVYPQESIPTNIRSVGSNEFLITTNESQYELSCRGQSIQKKDCQAYALVTVPCTCTLHVAQMSVTPSLTGCYAMKTEIRVAHPINYALFLSFDFKPHQFPALTLSNTSVELDVPDVRSYVLNFTDTTVDMMKDGLNLQQVAQAINEARSTYNKRFIDLDADLTFLPFVESPKFVFVFSIITMLALIAAAVVIVMIIIKVRKIDMAVAVLAAAGDMVHEMIPRANAVKLTKVIAPTPEDTEPVQVQPNVFSQYVGYFMLILIGILVLRCLVNLIEKGVSKAIDYARVWLSGKATTVSSSTLCLLISNDTRCVMIHLKEVPIPRGMITGCEAPKYLCISWSDARCSMISVKWSDNIIGLKVGEDLIEYDIPSNIPVPVARRKDMSRILEEDEKCIIFMVIDRPIQYLSKVRQHNRWAGEIDLPKPEEKFECIEMKPIESEPRYRLYPRLPTAPLDTCDSDSSVQEHSDMLRAKIEAERQGCKGRNDEPNSYRHESGEEYISNIRAQINEYKDKKGDLSQADRVKLLARLAIPPNKEARIERNEMKMSFNPSQGESNMSKSE